MINENDTTTTDEISFGNNDFLAAQVAILLGAEQLLLLTDAERRASPPIRDMIPRRELIPRSGDFDELEGFEIGHHDLAARLWRDALEGGRRGDGDRGGDPDGDRGRPGRREIVGGRGRASRSAPRFPRGRVATRASSCG